MAARLGRNFTVKQDGKGNAVIVKKPWSKLDTSAQIRARKSKKVRVCRRGQLMMGTK